MKGFLVLAVLAAVVTAVVMHQREVSDAPGASDRQAAAPASPAPTAPAGPKAPTRQPPSSEDDLLLMVPAIVNVMN